MRKGIFLVLILLSFGIVSCKKDIDSTQIDYVRQEFLVSFDSNGGSYVEPQIIEEGKLVQRPKNPIKKDYNFIGWYLGNTQFDFSTPITSKIKLTARWDVIRYTVTFDSDGGSEISAQQIEIGQTISIPENPNREKYSFIGWYLEDGFGWIDENEFDFSTPIFDNIKLKAKWIETYTVTFDFEGACDNIEKEVIKGNLVASEDASWTKHRFDGWYLYGEKFDFSTPIFDNIKLKAKWIETYTVTFDFEGACDNIEKEVIKGNLVTSEDASWTKHRFDGWYLDGEKFDFSTPIISDITLKAKWIKICTVTFVIMNYEEGEWKEHSSYRQVKQYDEGQHVTDFNPFEEVLFSGWYLGGKKFDFENTVLVDDIELIGKLYRANLYNNELNLENGWGKSQYSAPVFTVITDKYSSLSITGMNGGWSDSSSSKKGYIEIKKSDETYRCYLDVGIIDTTHTNYIGVAKDNRDTTLPFYTNNFSLIKVERRGTFKNQWNYEVDYIDIYVACDF